MFFSNVLVIRSLVSAAAALTRRSLTSEIHDRPGLVIRAGKSPSGFQPSNQGTHPPSDNVNSGWSSPGFREEPVEGSELLFSGDRTPLPALLGASHDYSWQSRGLPQYPIANNPEYMTYSYVDPHMETLRVFESCQFFYHARRVDYSLKGWSSSILHKCL